MLSISLESCEVNELRNELREVANSLEELIDTLAPLFLDNNVSLEVLETTVSEAVRSLSRRLLEISVCKQAGEEASEPVDCPECAQACRPWTKRERSITTMCGT